MLSDNRRAKSQLYGGCVIKLYHYSILPLKDRESGLPPTLCRGHLSGVFLPLWDSLIVLDFTRSDWLLSSAGRSWQRVGDMHVTSYRVSHAPNNGIKTGPFSWLTYKDDEYNLAMWFSSWRLSDVYPAASLQRPVSLSATFNTKDSSRADVRTAASRRCNARQE